MRPFSIEEYKQTYITESRLNWLYKQKLFKIFVPTVYGGLQLSMSEGVKQLIEVARLQGGLGWTVNLGAGANWFSGFFNDDAAQEIFLPEQAVIAGSGFTSGNWEKFGDEFSIIGTWSRCTGAKHASFFSLNASDDHGNVRTFVVPRSQVTLSEEKWPIFGLRNTSSYSIEIQQQRIPSNFEFEINAIRNTHAYDVHKIPFESFARLCMSASFIGIVQCFIDQCRHLPLNDKSISFIQESIAPCVVKSEANCVKWAEAIVQKISSTTLSDEVEAEMRSSLGNENVKLYHLVQELFFLSGLPLVEEDKIPHWAYRDVLTAVQHYMVKP